MRLALGVPVAAGPALARGALAGAWIAEPDGASVRVACPHPTIPDKAIAANVCQTGRLV